MLKIEIKGLDAVKAQLQRELKQVQFATAVALTSTARDVQQAVRVEMARVLDRPTPYALSGLVVRPATRANLEATVQLRDVGRNPPAVVFGQQFTGGGRTRKAIELRFASAGLITGSEYLAPGPAAQLDRFGNVSRAQAVAILRALGLLKPPASRSTRPRAVRPAEFFWSPGGRLRRGLWQRIGRSVRLVLMPVARPSYRPTIDMLSTARPIVAARFAAHFDQAYRRALATAR